MGGGCMFQGKMKAVTCSYDDGVTQDIRFIALLDRYGLKATFNLNSRLLGLPGELVRNGVTVNHNKISPADCKAIYAGHEVAVHTLTHPNLTTLSTSDIVYQVEQDRLRLSELVGYEVVGMAYPCGGVNNDERVADIIKNHTGVQYARTITTTESFDQSTNLYRFNPTVYHIDMDDMFALAERFLSSQPTTPQVFYIWGHSYELDAWNLWGKMETFMQYIAGKEDVFYGTNREILLS